MIVCPPAVGNQSRRAAEQQLPQLILAPLERKRSKIDAFEFQQV